ncbi:MAG: hypothetical protein RIT40_655 [Planctomycetota bacterium]|jgi:hypothetical protein
MNTPKIVVMSGFALCGLALAFQAGRGPAYEYKTVCMEAPRKMEQFASTTGSLAFKRATEEGWEFVESQRMTAPDGEFLVVFMRRVK